MSYDNENMVCENGFFDEKYFSEELPDDFFSCVSQNFSEDPIVKFSRDKIVIGGVDGSHFHKINYDKHIIEVGASEVEPLRYEIDHDEDSVVCVQDWYDSFCRGSNKAFPDVPVADIHVPGNQLEKKKVYEIQMYMARNGFALGNPSYTDAYYMTDYCDLVSDHPLTLQEQDIAGYDKKKKIFFPFSDDRRVGYERMITMQFNPFHPMSLSRILEIYRENEYEYVGKYKLYNKVYSFSYSLRDTRYRIHSDQWMMMARTFNSVYEIFDLVGNYDFIEDLYTDRGYRAVYFDLQKGYQDKEQSARINEKERRSVVQPVFVSPYMVLSSVVKKEGYSVIGPWGANPRFGVGDVVYVPYVTFSIGDVYIPEKKYKDITNRCNLNEKTGRLAVRNSVGSDGYDLLERYKYGDYFVMKSKWDFRVYQEDPDGIHNFIKVPYHVFSYPTNGEQSLILPFKFISPISYFQLKKHSKNIVDYLPMSILDKNRQDSVSLDFDDRLKEDDDLYQEFEKYVLGMNKVRRRHFKGLLSDSNEFLGILQDNDVSGFVVYRDAFFDGEIQFKGEVSSSYERFMLEELEPVPEEKGFKVVK